LAAELAQSAFRAESPVRGVDVPPIAADVPPAELAVPENEVRASVGDMSPEAVTIAAPAVEPPSVPRPSAPVPPAVASASAPLGGVLSTPLPELQPLSGESQYRFRLDELHGASLSDWPPAAIRNDPERRRLRQEAEQAMQAHAARLRSVVIASPYPARSYCLGAADVDASELRLSFLLFPVVWPVSQNQAVAQAVFRVDGLTGTIHGWVDALRSQELSEENRREIREAGGAA